QLSITVKGDCPVRNGFKLIVAILYKDAKVEERSVTVGSQKFFAKFGPWKKVFCPGTYEARIALPAALQRPELTAEAEHLKLSKDRINFTVGTAADASYREYTVKAKMI